MKSTLLIPLLILLVLIALLVRAQDLEPPTPAATSPGNYLLDEPDWLTGEQESEINSIIRNLDFDRMAEMAVVTLDDCGSDKIAFRRSLFNTWGIGHVDDKDGGGGSSTCF